MIVRIAFIAAAAVVGFWAFRRWRRAIQLAMVLLVVEGALRKWVLPGAQELLYFAKDGLLLAAYAGFLSSPGARSRSGLVPPALAVGLGVAAGVGMLQIFNPNLPNLLVGLLGFKSYFLYAPLLWVLPASFRSREELWRYLYLYALLALPLGILALAQFGSPADSAINTYARVSEAGAFSFGTSKHARVTSTFSFISGYTSYLFATAMLLFGLLTSVRWALRRYLALYGALALTLVGMMATGSRGPVVLILAVLPLYWWLSVARDRGGPRIMARILTVASILALLLGLGAAEVVDAFQGRASTMSDVGGRMLSPMIQPFLLAGEAGLFGFGIGATHQAASALVDTSQAFPWTRAIIIEDETGRVMMELGILGFLPFYFTCISLAVFAFRKATQLRDHFCRSLAVASFLFLLASLPGGIVFNVTAGLYYWFFAGLLFLVVRLDRETADAKAATSKNLATQGLRHVPSPAVGAAARNRS